VTIPKSDRVSGIYTVDLAGYPSCLPCHSRLSPPVCSIFQHIPIPISIDIHPNMVSCDDTIAEESPLDFDEFNFDKPEDEYQTAPISEDEGTLVDSDMEMETPVVSGMELDVEDDGVAPSQV
jgi:hypothetical protein